MINDKAYTEKKLRILMLEDSIPDAILIEDEIKKNNLHYTVLRVDDELSFKKAIEDFKPDIILSDFSLPSYDGFMALDEVRGRDSDIPFIFVSGVIGEKLAIEALTRGATDCVNKNYIGKLPGAIQRAVMEAGEHKQRVRVEKAIDRLRRRNLLILDSTSDGIAGLNNEMKFVFINSAALAMLGYGIKDMLAQTIDFIIAGISADANNPNNFIRDSSGISSGLNFLQLKRMDGSVFSAELAANYVEDEGGILKCVISFRDITNRLKAEDDLLVSHDKMRRIMFDSINAMSIALEFRDPYTAGHQRRVAELASAISRSMNLPEDRIDGIYLAGTIHDIGKIYVPAEILVKPSKLTDLEFKMIQFHSEAGFQILKDVDYPWPIAESVYQHHERMDGTGYPRRLNGAEIIQETRIIAVADVVEAMISHRPYRAAIGVDAALMEIRSGSGKIYDAEIVNVCLSLFENGFAFK